MTAITAHQPLYVPWLGFFHKMMLSQKICILDSVQFSRGDFVNRNRIKSPFGAKWLTIPVVQKDQTKKIINDIRIADNDWVQSHLNLLSVNYSKADYFEMYFSKISSILSNTNSDRLIDYVLPLIYFINSELRIDATLVKSSSLDLQGKKSDLILEICEQLEAEIYISGLNGTNYLEKEKFAQRGISIKLQQYSHPQYKQLNGIFMENMSILDLLFNCGPASRDIILSGNAINSNLMSSWK